MIAKAGSNLSNFLISMATCQHDPGVGVALHCYNQLNGRLPPLGKYGRTPNDLRRSFYGLYARLIWLMTHFPGQFGQQAST
ncbi:hypothetical protein AAFF_G00195010 [Aldrovandia affinis]|uniref:Uncharacterized protein n=1 Tax=Aldrovandia affinis TaxID=143900 RepID=A0AAD7SXH6_9TELE|nr:hypothetical protein AAFF_G00195010 [Aldrovandia affinis]